ncbi:hypothetical protein Tco_1299361 [Tanacetum coccineum]
MFTKRDHEQCYHEQTDSIKPTYDDDQIDSNIIRDDPHVEVNSENDKDNNVHDQKNVEFELYGESDCLKKQGKRSDDSRERSSVVKQVSAIVCVARFGFKEPPLSELDRDVMELFETEIKKRLKH